MQVTNNVYKQSILRTVDNIITKVLYTFVLKSNHIMTQKQHFRPTNSYMHGLVL